MIECRRCGVSQPHDSFSATKKNLCKSCISKENKEYRAKNREAINDRMREYQKEYRVRTKDERVKVNKAWRHANKEKAQAHIEVQKAKLRGDLVAPDSCQDCGVTGRLEGHHEDYSKPLEVDWLCSSCHRLRHEREKQATA